MSDWKEDALRHKYDPLPEEGPRHRKRARKAHRRSDHRHDYEDVAIDAHSYIVKRGNERKTFLYIGKRCTVCGRLDDVRPSMDMSEPPEGMRLFEVESIFELMEKYLPGSLEVIE